MELACQHLLGKMERAMHKMNVTPKEAQGMVNVQGVTVYVAYVSTQSVENNLISGLKDVETLYIMLVVYS